MKPAKAIYLPFILFTVLFPALFLPISQLGLAETGAAEVQFFPQTEVNEITVNWGGKQHRMELEEYVIGVVLAEMPADFEMEALKAQATVARTYAWKASVTSGKHGDHSVCTDSTCCQGYVPAERYIRFYGTEADVKKVRDAVEATRDTVITYHNELIEATYFSSSGGFTEDAAEVWGNDYPYLISKESPESVSQGERTSAFSSAYLENTLHTRLEGSPEVWFREWERARSGSVSSVVVGNRKYTGTELRQLLKLDSTVFSVSIQNDVVSFHTKGQGHRVGMSQYGAEAMAAQGSSWEEILEYYYSGVTLEKISDWKDTSTLWTNQ